MSKNVLVITTSLRPNSNSDLLADSFLRGALQAGNHVETVSLRGATMSFCRGCLSCQDRADGHCIMRDDADAIVQKMRAADVICFATPIYYYEMSGQMKTLLDRANPLYCVDYAFRDIYMVATAADGEFSAFDRAVQGLGGWIACFKNARLAGVVRGGGHDAAGTVANDRMLLDEAFQMGFEV